MSSTSNRTSGVRGEDLPLAATVDRLRDELEGLRRAMRSRAAIEQAKGMLMERHGCGPEDAFERLARLSQHANIKLADVAGALVDAVQAPPAAPRPTSGSQLAVGAVTPADVARAAQHQALHHWPRQVSGQSSFGTRVRAQARRTRTRNELLAAEQTQEVLDAVVRTALADHAPYAAALARIDLTGTVVLLGAHGIAPPVVARWHRVPVDLPLPVCVTARTGQARWLRRSPAQPAMLGLGLPQDWTCAALLPLNVGVDERGILAMLWADDWRPGEAERAWVDRVTAAAAAAIRRLSVTGPGSNGPERSAGELPFEDPGTALLDTMLHPVLVCEPVISSTETVTDLRITHANPAAIDPAGRCAEQLTGRTLLELFPDCAHTGLFQTCVQVWNTGHQADLPQHEWRATVRGQPRSALADTRVTRYRTGVMITWSGFVGARRQGRPGRTSP